MALGSALFNVMTAAARKATRGLVRDFGELENLQVSKKGPGDFVSLADTRAEEVLQRELTKARPDYGFLLEEGGVVKGTDARNRWIVDPLDGTTNFLHGLPHFAISVALEREGELIAGLVYDVVKDEMFWAEKGAGAYVNERRIRVSARTKLGEALVATGTPIPAHGDHRRFIAELSAVLPAVAGVRRMGSAALDLAYIAAGRFDAYWERNLQPWDIAAGIVLVREAGGFLTELDGAPDVMKTGHILASNATLGDPLAAILRRVAAPQAG
jgi:myo-inositol-1(or 4)-monophosphatase